MFDDYESDNKVFQISGFSPLTHYLNPTVLYPRISTWGWGTSGPFAPWDQLMHTYVRPCSLGGGSDTGQKGLLPGITAPAPLLI